jgi:succinoglycan biosynthesis protein ExoM
MMQTIAICVCTFRRKHIANTLLSLSRLKLNPDWDIHIIVADNDDTASAQNLVEMLANQYGLSLTYIHAPARNISVARNACLNASPASFLAFIDDDEIATPEWLHALVTKLVNDKADIVLGPVQANYSSECPVWIRRGDFHSARPVTFRNEIRTGYSGNVLIQRTKKSLQSLRFREDLGRSGGEDTVFFRKPIEQAQPSPMHQMRLLQKLFRVKERNYLG